MSLVNFNTQLLLVEQKLNDPNAKLTEEQKTELLNQKQFLQAKIRDAEIQKGLNGQASKKPLSPIEQKMQALSNTSLFTIAQEITKLGNSLANPDKNEQSGKSE